MHFPYQNYDLSFGLDTQALRDQKIKTATADKGPRGWWINFLHEAQLPFIDVVDEHDVSVAPRYKNDPSGERLFNEKEWLINQETELIGDFYYVSKTKLRQMFAKSIGRKLDEIEPRAFGLTFASFFPELDENGKIVMINNERRVKNVLRDGKSKGGVRDRVSIYKIPKLSVCRRMMNAVVGYAIDWDNMDKEWEITEFD